MTAGKILVTTSAVLIVGVAALFSQACSKATHVEADSQGSAAPTVAVAKAKTEDMSRGLIITAEFKPYQEIPVMAKVAGYVKNIYVDVGSRVKKGDLLAVLEIPEMADDQARAQSVLSRSQAEVAHARDELKRAETARNLTHVYYTRLADAAKQKAGLIAQQDIDDAENKDLVAEAQISAAKSSLSAAEQQVQVSMAELQRIKTLLEYTRVTAPFTGVITKRYADEGSMIPAGTSSSTQVTPVVRLSENSRLRLVLPVPESAVPTVHIGQQVAVRVPTLDRSFPGQVARFADQIAMATRTMDTEVDVENPSLVLIPGMFAEVNLTLDHRAAVLAVPVAAVDASNGATSGQVMVVTPDNRVATRSVQLGLQTGDNVEIRSGLRDGDLVVTSSRASLHDGQDVLPKLVDMAAKAAN
ncbi:MAG: efflux RND transporter periplasmic adaptor subunit [Acidobacteriia bacterium]|nr:efflux RND transporter periplasmic adaptor subunit [Terriglobia bacterium]